MAGPSELLTLQWQEQPETAAPLWATLRVPHVIVRRPVCIRLSITSAAVLPQLRRLLRQLRLLLELMGGQPLAEPELAPLLAPAAEAYLLEVVMADGHTSVAMQERWRHALEAGERAWLLPLLPALPLDAFKTLPDPLQLLNAAFWHGKASEDLALTVLARAGVTDLDRRVFISYRRLHTQPMAQQLFAALTSLNYNVFLDTVSIQAAVGVQASLQEQLVNQSMVVVLQSPGSMESPWVREEVKHAIANQLSLLIVRLPGLADAEQIVGARRSDLLDLQAADLRRHEQGPPYALKQRPLQRLVRLISEVHDLELVRRIASMRQRTLEAVQRHGLSHSSSGSEGAIHLTGLQRGCSLLPSGRPPGISDLHEASTRTAAAYGDQRVVVGHTLNIPLPARQRIDWAIKDRNVQYCDVTMLDSLFESLQANQTAPRP